MQEKWEKGIEREMTFRIIIAVFIALGTLMPLEAGAQTRSGTGFKPLLPIVPVVPPRDLESEAKTFPQAPRGPMTELLESATTSDAILEVIVGQGRILTTNEPIAREGGIALVATGDPSVIDFEVAGPRLLRILGRRVGVTDLSITTDAGQTYTFDVHVMYDLPLMTAYLQEIFPDALIELKQLREHVVLQGQARSVEQIGQIVQTLGSYLRSAQVPNQVTSRTGRPEVAPQGGPEYQPLPEGEPTPAGPTPIDVPDDRPRTPGTNVGPQIINLMRVPGVHQVMLKVQIAELNRTALRQIGADMLKIHGSTILGTNMAGSLFDLDLVTSEFTTTRGTGTTAFGIFNNGDFQLILTALRSNGVASVLAEPNLVTLNGQEASFHAGGEVPVPRPSGLTGDVTAIEYKRFGVLLNFVPTILDDETIRLRVAPEVSDFRLVGLAGPIFETRNLNTTVELKQGQTLALAGLLQVKLDASTTRIPGLGDLPYLGALFSNTTHQRIEKELLVLVTPYLVSPMEACQAPPMPGCDILDPKDLEFYLMNRIEGRTGEPHRTSASWDDPLAVGHLLKLEHRHCYGPVGYSE